jgi:peptidyl-prolyl cis-trans isomerase SurA
VRWKIVVSPQEVAQVAATLTTPPPAAQTPSERLEAFHILIRVTDTRTPGQALARINEAYQELVRGAEFSDVAKRYSEDASAEAGGLIGWVARGELMPELNAALFNLTGQPRDFSTPIRTSLGYHLVKVGQRRTSATVRAEEATTRATRQLYEQKFDERLGQWLEELRGRAYIDLRAE